MCYEFSNLLLLCKFHRFFIFVTFVSFTMQNFANSPPNPRIILYAPSDLCRAWFHLHMHRPAVKNGQLAKNSKWKFMDPVGFEPAIPRTTSWRLDHSETRSEDEMCKYYIILSYRKLTRKLSSWLWFYVSMHNS